MPARPEDDHPDNRQPPDEAAQPAADDRDSAYELFRRGSQLLAERHPGAAAVVLERASRLEPGKASILEALGRAYFNQGEHGLAAERFREIVERDPVAHYAHFGLGLAEAQLGHPSLARRHLKIAVSLKPEIEDYRRALRRVEVA
jgi:Flp pilus assembly protein TadD